DFLHREDHGVILALVNPRRKIVSPRNVIVVILLHRTASSRSSAGTSVMLFDSDSDKYCSTQISASRRTNALCASVRPVLRRERAVTGRSISLVAGGQRLKDFGQLVGARREHIVFDRPYAPRLDASPFTQL